MPPVGAFIGAIITSASIGAATAAFAAAGGWLAVGTFILTQVVLWGVGKLLAPKQNRGGERQADTLAISLGENPREAIFGQIATGGQLVDCWNHDSGTGDARKNRAEVLVIKLADHEVQSLEGMYVNDEFHAFTGDGDVAAFVISGFGWGLRVYFRAGTTGQTPPSFITTNSGGKWTSAKTMAGCAHVYVVYADNKDRTIWPGGRPRFSWVVKGAKLYDPRKDSTVAGGSGSHVWGTPATYEWSENAYLIRYNWVRGIYNYAGATPQLMVGRGLSAEEVPPERAISRANICDENVTLKAGGTEKRYRAGGVVKSSDAAIDVEEWLAASMAGLLVDRDGVIDIDPGAAQSTVFAITDADLVAGREIQYSPHLNENQRLNTVVARWIDPAQRYADVSTAPRKVAGDITADGRPYDVTIDLPFVLSGTQAQRIAEIRRRQGRLERVFSLPLGPKFIGIETGDWVTYQSDRYLGGGTITGVATAVALGEDWQVNVAIREINSNVYAWTAASDEQTKGTVLAASTAAPGAIVVDTFTATASTLTTSAGTDPAIQCTWLAFEDGAVSGIEFQVRKNGDTKITTTLVEDTTSLQAFVTAGVGAQGSFDIRARGVSRVPGRTATWTSWSTISTGGSTYDNGAIQERSPNLVFFSPAVAGAVGYEGNQGTASGFVLSSGTTSGRRWAKWSGTFAGAGLFVTLYTAYAYRFPVVAGQRYSAQTRIETTGAINNSDVNVYWYDAAGAYISASVVATQSGLQSYGTLVQGFVTAPANAVAAFLLMGVGSSGAGAASVSLIEPDVSLVGPDRTTHPPFAPGRNAYDAADVTANNAAAAIVGQSPLATLTPPSYAGNAAAFAALGAGKLFTDTSDSNNIKTSFDPASATASFRAGDSTPGATTTISGTSWTTLDTFSLTALASGRYADPSLCNIAGSPSLSADGVMSLNWRLTIGAQTVDSGTFTITQVSPDPAEYNWTEIVSRPIALSVSGNLTGSFEVQRVSGVASATSVQGIAAALII